MTNTPNRPPLWDVMEQARDAVIAAHHPFAREEQCLAAPVPVAERLPGPEDCDGRDPECVKRWPDCFDGGYHPSCCRFPKSCSCGPRARAALAAEADGPAVPESREPASVVGEPSDEELLELWQGWNLGWDPQKGMVLMLHPAEYARAVLARWGHQPAPPAEDDCPACEGVPKPGNQPCAVCGRPALAAEAVVEGPSLEEVECLCEEHCFNVEGYESIECLQGLINEAIFRYGHQPAPPAEGEVAELAAKLRRLAPHNPLGTADPTITRAADLLERQATACAICERERLHQSTRAADLEVERQAAPVPVSERLPGPEDCNEYGKCWAWRGFDPDVDDDGEFWQLTPAEWLDDDDGEFWQLTPAEWLDEASCWTHWLPATALPLPQGEVQP